MTPRSPSRRGQRRGDTALPRPLARVLWCDHSRSPLSRCRRGPACPALAPSPAARERRLCKVRLLRPVIHGSPPCPPLSGPAPGHSRCPEWAEARPDSAAPARRGRDVPDCSRSGHWGVTAPVLAVGRRRVGTADATSACLQPPQLSAAGLPWSARVCQPTFPSACL